MVTYIFRTFGEFGDDENSIRMFPDFNPASDFWIR